MRSNDKWQTNKGQTKWQNKRDSNSKGQKKGEALRLELAQKYQSLCTHPYYLEFYDTLRLVRDVYSAVKISEQILSRIESNSRVTSRIEYWKSEKLDDYELKNHVSLNETLDKLKAKSIFSIVRELENRLKRAISCYKVAEIQKTEILIKEAEFKLSAVTGSVSDESLLDNSTLSFVKKEAFGAIRKIIDPKTSKQSANNKLKITKELKKKTEEHLKDLEELKKSTLGIIDTLRNHVVQEFDDLERESLEGNHQNVEQQELDQKEENRVKEKHEKLYSESDDSDVPDLNTSDPDESDTDDEQRNTDGKQSKLVIEYEIEQLRREKSKLEELRCQELKSCIENLYLAFLYIDFEENGPNLEIYSSISLLIYTIVYEELREVLNENVVDFHSVFQLKSNCKELKFRILMRIITVSDLLLPLDKLNEKCKKIHAHTRFDCSISSSDLAEVTLDLNSFVYSNTHHYHPFVRHVRDGIENGEHIVEIWNKVLVSKCGLPRSCSPKFNIICIKRVFHGCEHLPRCVECTKKGWTELCDYHQNNEFNLLKRCVNCRSGKEKLNKSLKSESEEERSFGDQEPDNSQTRMTTDDDRSEWDAYDDVKFPPKSSCIYRIDYSPEEIIADDFETNLDEQLALFPVDVKFDMMCATALYVTSESTHLLQYELDNKWISVEDGSYGRFLAAVLWQSNDILPFVKNMPETMTTVDVWDEDGTRPLHRLIDSFNGQETICNNIIYLLWYGKTDISHNDKDKIDLVDWCDRLKKGYVRDFISETRVSINAIPKIREFFMSWMRETPDANPLNLEYSIKHEYYELFKSFSERSLYGAGVFDFRQTGPDKIFTPTEQDRVKLEQDDVMYKFGRFLKTMKIEFSLRFDEKEGGQALFVKVHSFLKHEKQERDRIRKEKRLEERKDQKESPKNSEKDEVSHALPIFTGGTKEKKPKSEPEKFESKFTDADRNFIYLKIHEAKCSRLYQECTPTRVYDQREKMVFRVALNGFKERVERILGDAYTDDIAYLVFAQEYFDPKNSSAFENSKCRAYYDAFKSRDAVENNVEAYEEEKDHVLVEVKKPVISSMLKKKEPRKKRKSEETGVKSVNLNSAKHEFLFLKGLFTWREELIKAEDIHNEIFEDCLKLGAIRFYNSLLLYARECKSGSLGDKIVSVSFDDHEAARIRNVLVHNIIPVEQIKTNVETVLFKLGERIVDICNGVKVLAPTECLSKSELFAMKVREYDPEADGSKFKYQSFYRELIKIKLIILAKYVALIESKESLREGSAILNSMNYDWEAISPALRVWIHPARAIESCILQIGEWSKNASKFLNPKIQKYVDLTREVRHVGYHVNTTIEDEWNFDPIAPDFLASMIKGSHDLNL